MVTDRFGVTWQITATVAETYMYGDDLDARQRVVTAILGMNKIDIETIESAARGDG